MASLTDIPAELLTSDARSAFVNWLSDIPLPLPTISEFIHIWQTQTNTQLDVAERRFLLRRSELGNGL